MPLHPEHRSIFAVDIEGFGRLDRTNPDRIWMHQRLRTLCERVASRAGIPSGGYLLKDTGDGFLLSLNAPKDLLLESVSWLRERLLRLNRNERPQRRMRVRVALHAGDVLSDPDPLHGDTVIFACRLLDAEELRTCLKATIEPVALIVSLTIWDNIVKHRFGRIDPAAYHHVIVRTKEERKSAWVHVPGDEAAPHRAGVVTAVGNSVERDGLIPRQLPAPDHLLVGRDAELARIVAVLRGSDGGHASVVALNGSAGAGKSALAVHAASMVANHYPDGLLYVDLRGPAPGLPPLTPLEVLQQFTRGLGTPATATPATLPQAIAEYRSSLAGRRVLVVLDNAQDVAQVRPLLPDTSGCAALITCRTPLPGLDGALGIALPSLSATDASALLGHLIGPERLAAEPAAGAEVVRSCGYLPLAIRIVAARLASNSTWQLGTLAGKLADARRRLNGLGHGDRGVRASFEVGYQALRADSPEGEAAARLFRLLGLLDGERYTAPSVAAVAGQEVAVVEATLAQLLDKHLIEQAAPGQYRLHDLLRSFARDLLAAQEPQAEQDGATARLLRFLRVRAERAATFLRPDEYAGAEVAALATAPGFDARDDALAWVEAELGNLVAAVEAGARAAEVRTAVGRAAADDAAGIAHALFEVFDLRGFWTEWERANAAVLRIATALGDDTIAGRAWNGMGILALRRADHATARDCLERGLDARRTAGDDLGIANSLSNLGMLHRHRERYREAFTCYRQSIAIYRRLGMRLREGQTLSNLGNVSFDLGRLDVATSCQTASLFICETHGHPASTARALRGLGAVNEAQGHATEGIACLQQAIAIWAKLGAQHEWADTIAFLGDLHRRRGALGAAVDAYHTALATHRTTGRLDDTAAALDGLGLALDALGLPDRATACWREALELLERVGDERGGARIRGRLTGR